MTINWGNWQEMPDYRQYVNPHQSGVTQIGRALDPTTYIPGANVVSNFVHDGADRVMTTANEVLSPLVKGINEYTNPMYKVNRGNFIGRLDDFAINKPADALAIAAASYFGAAALAAEGGASGGAAAGASEGIGSAGSTAASTTITPIFESGAAGTAGATTAASGAGAITPQFAASGLTIAPEAAGYGTLGASGTAAGETMLTPAFESLGGAASGGGLFNTVKDAYNTFSKYDKYRANMQRFADNEPDNRNIARINSAALADKILNDNNPVSPRNKVAKQMMINRWGMR